MSFNRQILSLQSNSWLTMDEKEVARLVEAYLWFDLKDAEQALINGQEAGFEIAGDTPGKQLTHVSAAIWVLEKMREVRCDFSTAMAQYRANLK